MFDFDLSGAREKVKWAKEHIKNLDGRRTTFLGLQPYHVVPEFYPERNFTVFFLDGFQPALPEISLLAGDAAHNLRTALDYLACELVKRNGNNPSTLTCFPIAESIEKYEAESPRKVEGMAKTDKEAISLLKPYKGGNDALWGLHRMDILDKHHLLTTAAITVKEIGIRATKEFIEREFKGRIRFAEGTVVPEKTIWFSATKPAPLLGCKQGDPIVVFGGNREGNQDVELTFDISLSEPEVFKGRSILECLHEVANLVGGIVDSFA